MTWPYSSIFMIEGMVTLTRIETQSVHRWSDKLFCLFVFVVFCVFFSVRLLSILRGHSGFFIPATTANDLRLGRIFYPRCYPLHIFSYLIFWERASIFPFEYSVLNKGTIGTILGYDAVLDWELNPGPPALEASTIPLGYWGRGKLISESHKTLCLSKDYFIREPCIDLFNDI